MSWRRGNEIWDADADAWVPMIPTSTHTPADDAGEAAAKVWCETCQHEHIPDIPAITWLCRDCGWGQWSEADAVAHVERQAGHRPYRVGHWIPARIRKVAKKHDEARAEADRLRVALGKVAAKVAEVDGWKPYESRDTGSVYLSDSVDDLVTDIRAILAADPVALADVRAVAWDEGWQAQEDYADGDYTASTNPYSGSETVTDHG